MKEKRFPAAFKCYHNFHKVDSTTNDSLHFKMVIHVHSDSAFRRYQKEMRYDEVCKFINALYISCESVVPLLILIQLLSGLLVYFIMYSNFMFDQLCYCRNKPSLWPLYRGIYTFLN